MTPFNSQSRPTFVGFDDDNNYEEEHDYKVPQWNPTVGEEVPLSPTAVVKKGDPN
jgi:hypothetical protein